MICQRSYWEAHAASQTSRPCQDETNGRLKQQSWSGQDEVINLVIAVSCLHFKLRATGLIALLHEYMHKLHKCEPTAAFAPWIHRGLDANVVVVVVAMAVHNCTEVASCQFRVVGKLMPTCAGTPIMLNSVTCTVTKWHEHNWS